MVIRIMKYVRRPETIGVLISEIDDMEE